MKKIVKTAFYDSSINSGHHYEFISHLLEQIIICNDTIEYIFILNRSMKPFLEKYNTLEKVQILFLDFQLRESFGFIGTIKESLTEVKELFRICNRLEVNNLIFLTIDKYQLALGLLQSTNHISIKGIFFKPYLRHRPKSTMFKEKIKNQVFKIYKQILIRFLFSNKRIDIIWILNDSSSVEILNKKFGGTKFKMLVDPIPDNREKSTSQIDPENYNLRAESNILLIFGSITPVKNIENIVKSLHLIPSNKHYTLLIIGHWKSQTYKKEIQGYINELNSENIEIIIDDRFVNENEINAIFKSVDVVLIPYLNFPFSSGVVGHASKFKKPIICSENSLISDLSEEYKLGLAVDPTSPIQIAQAIEKLTENAGNYTSSKMNKFVSERTPSNFANTILNSNK